MYKNFSEWPFRAMLNKIKCYLMPEIVVKLGDTSTKKADLKIYRRY